MPLHEVPSSNILRHHYHHHNVNQRHDSAAPRSTLHGTSACSVTVTDGPAPYLFFLISQVIPALSPNERPSPSKLKETRAGTMKDTLLLMQEIHSFI